MHVILQRKKTVLHCTKLHPELTSHQNYTSMTAVQLLYIMRTTDHLNQKLIFFNTKYIISIRMHAVIVINKKKYLTKSCVLLGRKGFYYCFCNMIS